MFPYTHLLSLNKLNYLNLMSMTLACQHVHNVYIICIPLGIFNLILIHVLYVSFLGRIFFNKTNSAIGKIINYLKFSYLFFT